MLQIAKKNRLVILIEDPLITKNVEFLEEVLAAADGHSYINAFQLPPSWKNVGIPANDENIPLNTPLEGGRILRQRYPVSEIKSHYRSLRNH